MEKLLINTAQNVQIEYQLASLGTRFLALSVDYMLMTGYGYLVYYLLRNLAEGISDKYLLMGIWMLFLLPVMMYHFILESFLAGQTVGKMIMKIKVVRLDGGRASVYEYFIRWVLNLVDIWMMSGVIGLLSIVMSKQSQRIGDMAAGTAVISLKPHLALNQTIYENLADTYIPFYPEYEIAKLTDEDVNIIKQSFRQAEEGNHPEVMARLAEKITEVTGAVSNGFGYDQFIETVLKDHFHYHKK